MSRPGAASRRGQSSSTAEVPPTSRLCLRCGMCCDGTLFARAPVRRHEIELVTRLDLPRRDREDSLGFRLPCVAFQDGCCSLYDTKRPQVCSGYSCGARSDYILGRIPFERACEIVDLMRAVVAELEVLMGLAPGTFDRDALHEYLQQHQPLADPDEHTELLRMVDRFYVLGLRYFGFSADSVDDEVTDVVPVEQPPD